MSKVALIGIVLCIASVFLVFEMLELRLNFTSSLPMGVYQETRSDAWRRGHIVVACPPVNAVTRWSRDNHILSWGLCAGGMTPIIKKIAGRPGDRVFMNRDGVWINGLLWPQSRLMPEKVPIHLIAQNVDIISSKPRVIPQGKFLLLSDWNSRSFDGRYFGFVDGRDIKAIITPIWVWP